MTQPLDEQYFIWLYSQVGSVKSRVRSRTYWSLLRQLYSKEFVWLVPNDDNRVEDGRDLRHEFVTEQGIEGPDPEWMQMGCSVLEMLVALSRRLAFESTGRPARWFWHLIENLKLNDFTDAVEYDTQFVDGTLDILIWRLYEPNGEGGLFPLRKPKEDQRRVEIWYQLSAYLLEGW